MRHGKSWIPRLATLMVVVLVGLVVMTAADTTSVITPDSSAPGAVAPGQDCRMDDPGAGQDAEFFLEQEGGSLEPAAICRLLPQCFSHSDCDAQCGVGLGRCVHSNCPPRLCRCR